MFYVCLLGRSPSSNKGSKKKVGSGSNMGREGIRYGVVVRTFVSHRYVAQGRFWPGPHENQSDAVLTSSVNIVI